MQLSTRGRYAVMAMAELAVLGGCGRPVTIAEIAAAAGLSPCYLEQLFAKLRRAGLLASARGPGGGYRLGRAPERLSVAEVVLAVDEPLHATRCAPGTPGCLDGVARCRTHELWHELGRQIHLFLSGITLADVLAHRVAGRAAPALDAAAVPDPALEPA